MCDLEQMRIDLKSIKDEEKALDYQLDDSFFDALSATEVKRGSLHVSVSIRKVTGFFEFLFHTSGSIVIQCDRCLDDMELPVDTDNRLVVKLGDRYSEEDDIIVVPEDEGILDIAWFIYEFVVLAIPIRHVHAPGKCNPAMAKALEELSADRSSEKESTQTSDPRWDKLKNVKF